MQTMSNSSFKPGGRQERGPKHADPWHCRLALGMWNITSLAGKEPELVLEVEQYQLDVAGLNFTPSSDSGTKLLKRGWTFSFSGNAQGERCWDTHEPLAERHCVGVLLGE